MTEITMPNQLQRACQAVTDTQKNRVALTYFLREKRFMSALLEHRKTFTDAPSEEYSEAFRLLLNQYQPGQAVNAIDISDLVIVQLNEKFENPVVKKTHIRESFVPFLKEQGIIKGDRPLLWAYMDTRTRAEKVLDGAKGLYRAHLEKTEAEIQFAKEMRNNAALKKVEEVVLANRGLVDDISNHLDYINKEEKRCRELAQSLNIPLSKVKEDMMNKRNTSGLSKSLGKIAFSVALGVVLVAGVLYNMGDDGDALLTDPMAGEMADSGMIEENPYGLTADENAWRMEYIRLYLDKNGDTSKMNALIGLSGEYMITKDRMQDIISTIDPATELCSKKPSLAVCKQLQDRGI